MSHMLTCQEFQDHLMEFVERTGSEELQTQIERHMDQCDFCLRYFDAYMATVRLGKVACLDCDESVDEIPETLVQQILKSARRSDSSDG